MMNDERRLAVYGRSLAVVLLIALLFPIYLRSVTAQEQAIPDTPPDASTGLAIYAGRCAGCHGLEGNGDGDKAADLPGPPPVFSEPAFRQTAVPASMFSVISGDPLADEMHPFGPAGSDPISEDDRWNLVAAVYSLATPAEVVAQGQTVYEENCLACHGATGLEDGPDAAELETPPSDLTNLAYWFDKSNEAIFASLESGLIPQHEYDLSENDMWAAIDYARTFSYAYVDPSALNEPIETATVSGQMVNGTSGEAVAGESVILHGITFELEEMVTMTETTGTDGRFTFNLTSVAPDWVYLINTSYNGINFNSDVGQVSHAQPDLELPITVYEPTTDPAGVSIRQLHLLLSFSGDQLLVEEFYVFSNRGAAVFVGKTGQLGNGTVEIELPTGAQNVSFRRAFGSSNTRPAPEIIQTGAGWADTLPLHPGEDSLNLLIHYELPYEDGMTIAHPLAYDATNVNVILPDAGVTLANGEWTDQGRRESSTGAFISYIQSNLPAGERLTLELNGRPQFTTGVSGNTLPARDEKRELLTGGGVLLIVIAAVAYIVYTWQLGTGARNHDDAESLLQAIADLDAAYEDGAMSQKQYTRQRERLKSKLIVIWREDEGMRG